MKSSEPAIGLLLDMIDAGFDKTAWHGPNLRGTLRRLSPAEAAWRPAASRHCIAEIVVHCAYWKYAVRRRLRGDKRGSFSLKGSNWFPVSGSLSEAAWRDSVQLLDQEHAALRAAVAEFPPRRLSEKVKGKVPYSKLIHGIASHDVYHAGQIRLLKSLMAL